MDPHSQAGEMGLLEPYKSPNLPQIVEQFRDPAKMKVTIPPPFILVY